jgi:hypothetical protein
MLGYEAINFREKCHKVLSIDIGIEALCITKIQPTGRLTAWNAQHAHAEVRVGDLIFTVNGAASAEEMQVQMRQCDVDVGDGTSAADLRIGRPAASFNARVEKGSRTLGLGFRNPMHNPAQHLFITDVLPDGAIAGYNASQLSAGRWDRLVLPEMIVSAVNGVEHDFHGMVKALSASTVVDLQVQRTSTQASNTQQSWEVVLDGDSSVPEEMGIGLDVLNFGDRCREKLGLDLGPDIVLVARVASSSLLATWNEQRPDSKVLQGDRLLAVNGSGQTEEILAALNGSPSFPIRLQVARPPWYFTARLERGEAGLGLGFKPLRGSQAFLVTEVLSKGAVTDYNSAQTRAGCWDHLILPGMIIKQVNGEGSSDAMRKALSTPGALDVHLQRAGPSPSAAPPETESNAYPRAGQAPEPTAPEVPLPPASPSNLPPSTSASVEDL